MLKEISGVTEAHIMQHLSAQEASHYSVRESRYAEPQQHSIKNSSADIEAINNGISHILLVFKLRIVLLLTLLKHFNSCLLTHQ